MTSGMTSEEMMVALRNPNKLTATQMSLSQPEVHKMMLKCAYGGFKFEYLNSPHKDTVWKPHNLHHGVEWHLGSSGSAFCVVFE